MHSNVLCLNCVCIVCWIFASVSRSTDALPAMSMSPVHPFL